MNNEPCPTCGFELYHPIAELKVSRLSLYDDGRFPGRSILALNAHQEHFEDLDEDLSHNFMLDAQNAIQGLKKVTGAKRVNFAILGNAVSHVHAHLIPRYPDLEAKPNSSPWDDPRPRQTLPPERKESLLQELIHSFMSKN